MLLEEAKQILEQNGYITESLPSMKNRPGLRWSGYTFKGEVKPGMSYVKILKALDELGGEGTKREIFDIIGWEFRPGNRSGIFSPMADEGFISYDNKTNKWKLTDMGYAFMYKNRKAIEDTTFEDTADVDEE
jgi:hypothetical protein